MGCRLWIMMSLWFLCFAAVLAITTGALFDRARKHVGYSPSTYSGQQVLYLDKAYSCGWSQGYYVDCSKVIPKKVGDRLLGIAILSIFVGVVDLIVLLLLICSWIGNQKGYLICEDQTTFDRVYTPIVETKQRIYFSGYVEV